MFETFFLYTGIVTIGANIVVLAEMLHILDTGLWREFVQDGQVTEE